MTTSRTRLSDKPIPFAAPDIGEAEIEAVVGVLRSGWLTTGEQCQKFEEEFAQAVGATHAVAVNSCTAAMHLSLEALGVGAGDLVFMSPYTFAATAEVVRYQRATPIFVDIDPVTLNIDPCLLREAVEREVRAGRGRPRAVMPVHIGGVPCEMDEIWAVARDYGLAVVEDAAHAFPASYRGRPIGSLPHGVEGTACFSFYATKTITTGEGGMLTTEDEALAERARSMSLHGLSRPAWGRYSVGGGWVYDVIAPGFKYNLTDIAGALGRVQLSRADDMRARRAEIAASYSAAFADVDALQCPSVAADRESAWHLYPLRINPERMRIGRDDFLEALRSDGIGASVHFIPLHLHSYYVDQYGYKEGDLPIATAAFERAVSLPIYSAMSDRTVERVIASVRSITLAGQR